MPEPGRVLTRPWAAFFMGIIVGGTFAVAGFAWALHWNAYTALALTLGSFVLLLTVRAALSAGEETP